MVHKTLKFNSLNRTKNKVIAFENWPLTNTSLRHPFDQTVEFFLMFQNLPFTKKYTAESIINISLYHSNKYSKSEIGLYSQERFTMVKMLKNCPKWTKFSDHVTKTWPVISEKASFFLDNRDHQEHDAKSRLSIPVPSSQKLMAEIIRLKKLTWANKM